MTPEMLAKTKSPQRTSAPSIPINTDGMNDQQRDALEVTESAREHTDPSQSLGNALFMGRLDPTVVMPFPQQCDEDRRIGDQLVEQVSTFLRDNLDPEEADDTRTIPADVTEGLQKLGVFRMKVPVEYGGLGLSQVNYNRVIMAVASHCGSTAVLISAHQSIGVPQPLKMFGTEQQKDKYLRRIAGGELSAFALTEADAGSDPACMATFAQLSEDGTYYVLNGSKQWTTNGPIADQLIVMAQTAPKIYRGRERRQITAFIVETDWPGVESVHRCDFMGLRAIHNGIIRFEDVKVPAENLLWGEGLGLKLALKTLNTGRLTLPAACTGLGKQCLSIVRRWGNERVQWGLPIGRHEAGRDKIAWIAATTFAMEAVTWLTSHWADQRREIRIEAAMAKLFCSEAAWRIIDLTMQFRAGRGYERAISLRERGETPYPVERMMRECRINTIIEGTSDIMRLFLAREALDPHLQIAGDMFRSDLTAGSKARCVARMASFYSRWYVATALRRAVGPRYRAAGPLRNHLRYVDRGSRRLAMALFHAMACNGPKLERKQVLLGWLMDIGTEMFVMTATCAYANAVAEPDREHAQATADVFCRQARRRIEATFRDCRDRDDRRSINALAGSVLDGGYEWLEEGIIRSCDAE